MAKPSKSQWNFGELFPVEQTTRKVISVAELTLQIRRLLEENIGRIWVTGEITNLRAQSSGHIYFVLKDSNAQISCVLFRGETQVDRSLLEDGRKVVLGGEITVYESRGQYQLRVTNIELQGIGKLQAAFERLKQKLNAEGLFAPERKRLLPKFPQRIGLVTSPTGAAIRDVLHVISRRDRSLQIILAACRVQGEGAGAEIARAIALLNDFHLLETKRGRSRAGLDLILLTRGGGSLEDLWAFNEEIVARAIFNSALPVVSAVGHEIDFSISDFVADCRAATPSAAAEIITEGVFSSCQFVTASADRIKQLCNLQVGYKEMDLKRMMQGLARVHPRHRLLEWSQWIDDFQRTAFRGVRDAYRRQDLALRNLRERLSRTRPSVVLRRQRELVENRNKRMQEKTRQRLKTLRHEIESLQSRLRLLGPEQVLARGYSITSEAETGHMVRGATEVFPGQKLKTRLKAGEIISVVQKSG